MKKPLDYAPAPRRRPTWKVGTIIAAAVTVPLVTFGVICIRAGLPPPGRPGDKMDGLLFIGWTVAAIGVIAGGLVLAIVHELKQ